jgi:hypothetical protein
VRQHTILGEAAGRWHARVETSADAEPLLLRGNALAEAELWISQRPRDAPEPTDLHRQFIVQSRRAEQVRLEREREQLMRIQRGQRRLAWALAVAAALVLFGLAAALQTARETSRREAVIFARESLAQFQDGYCDRAMRLAIAGLPPPGASPLKVTSQTTTASSAARSTAAAARS